MEVTADFLVLGSGIAGLSFAIKAADLGTVAIVTKKEKSDSNTNLAQGGIAAVFDKNDRFEFHISDTLVCGAGLSKEEVVRFVITNGPDRIKELMQWGVEFTKTKEGNASSPDLGREGGHSMRRVLHAKDLTGQEIERALHEKASLKRNITIYENHIGIDLILESALQGKKRGLETGALVRISWIPKAMKSIPSKQNLSFYLRAERGRSISSRQIPILPPVTASPWRTGREPSSPIWNLYNFIRHVSITPTRNRFLSAKRCGEKEEFCD